MSQSRLKGDAPAWWKSAVVYQVWPRSFADGNGDGIGDLQGLIARLDYLKWLGVDVVWLSPVFRSPQDDNGYDISDYHDIDPDFGTLADMDALIAGLHQRGMRLVSDLVVNHTSDAHPWFQAARSSRDDPKRDWYIWRDTPEDGTAPNNWMSRFSGSAWEPDSHTGQSYLHIFARSQPDLNWANPAMRAEIWRMMRWWLDRGIDGFRMDVINFISKADGLPDDPQGNGQRFYANGPRLIPYLQEMQAEVLSHATRPLMTVGETPLTDVETARALTDPAGGGLDMVFQFEHMGIDMDGSRWKQRPMDFRALKSVMARWQAGLADTGWNSLYFGNHDQPRILSRWGDPVGHPVASAKALATVMHLHRGTPYIYQGEEIGMQNLPLPTPADLRDVQSINYFNSQMAEDPRRDPEEVMQRIRPMARDTSRSPMQWNDGPWAGFSSVAPWMPLHPDYAATNVAAQRDDAGSVLHHTRALIALRHDNPVIALGDCRFAEMDHQSLYVLLRQWGDDRAVMVANLGGAFVPRGDWGWLPDLPLALGNIAGAPSHSGALQGLRPWEALVFMGATA